MTMLDDDRLAALLAQAGASFEVPADGAATIVARATGLTPASYDAPAVVTPAGDSDGDGDGDAPGRAGVLTRLGGTARRHRILTVAACLLVAFVVAGTVGALVRSPARQQVTSSLPGTPGRPSPPSGSAPRTFGGVQARPAPGAPSRGGKGFAAAGASGAAGRDRAVDSPVTAERCGQPARQDRADGLAGPEVDAGRARPAR